VLPVIAGSSPPLESLLLPSVLGEMVEPPVLLPLLNIAGPAPRYGGLSRRDVPPVWMIN
jgi:hypothetical protein